MTTILHIDRSVYAKWWFIVAHQLVMRLFRGSSIPTNSLQFHSLDSLHVANLGVPTSPLACDRHDRGVGFYAAMLCSATYDVSIHDRKNKCRAWRGIGTSSGATHNGTAVMSSRDRGLPPRYLQSK